MKILLAEDEKALSDAEVAVLRHFGYEVDAAYDGLSAWQMAEHEAYDCIVLDIMMPKMDGIEVLAKLRGSGSTVPIIMLTAKTEVDDRIAGLDAGADDYLTKPFAMGEFLARIRSMTRRANAFTLPSFRQAASRSMSKSRSSRRRARSVSAARRRSS